MDRSDQTISTNRGTDATKRRGKQSARRRGYDLPPILRAGFRPFFLLGATFAPMAVLIWIAELSGIALLSPALDALAWHQHEMLFGFTSAIIAGFILTAIPNWTGRLPVAGTALAALASLWLAGRLAMLASGTIGAPITALIDAAFLFVLALLIAREIISGSNWRNLPPAFLIAGLFIERFFCRYFCPLGAAFAIPSRLRQFEWLKHRWQCGRQCQICAVGCPVQAIHPEGQINPGECIYWLACQVNYLDDHVCPALIERRKRRERRAAAIAKSGGMSDLSNG